MTQHQSEGIFSLITSVLRSRDIPFSSKAIESLLECALKKNEHEVFFCPTEECQKKLNGMHEVKNLAKEMSSHLKSQITLKCEVLNFKEFHLSYKGLDFVCIPLKAYLAYLRNDWLNELITNS